jgi:hypothetical protein
MMRGNTIQISFISIATDDSSSNISALLLHHGCMDEFKIAVRASNSLLSISGFKT